MLELIYIQVAIQVLCDNPGGEWVRWRTQKERIYIYDVLVFDLVARNDTHSTVKQFILPKNKKLVKKTFYMYCNKYWRSLS